MLAKANYAFIDGQNFHKGSAEAGISVDYKRFRIYLKEKYRVENAYLFMGYLPGNAEMYAKRKAQGYLLEFKPVLEARGEQKQKGDVDAHLAFTVMRQYSEYAQAVIVTSDGDYDTMVSYLRREGKLAAVISPNRKKCSALLKIAAAGKMQFLEDFAAKISRSEK